MINFHHHMTLPSSVILSQSWAENNTYFSKHKY